MVGNNVLTIVRDFVAIFMVTVQPGRKLIFNGVSHSFDYSIRRVESEFRVALWADCFENHENVSMNKSI